MSQTIKTDNHDPSAKLALRRHFLDAYHKEAPPHVMDCCAGSGKLWGELRQQYTLGSYWALDLKPKKGRLKLDSVRVLQQRGWTQDVIDVDTYGSPWSHWLALLPNVKRPTTVFLTVGQVAPMGSPLFRHVREALGLGTLHIPNAISAKLNAMAARHLLARASAHGLRIALAIEAESTGNARYLGVRLELA